MSEEVRREQSCGDRSRGVHVGNWWTSHPDVGLPPLLEPGDSWWMKVEWLRRSLAAWPALVSAPLFVPYVSNQKISKEPFKWTVHLDVAHFSPSEISLSVKDGFLVVEGKHGERRDEHGFIARCFTRKYRLPAEIDAAKITSTLSIDGVLTVEAPAPEESVPTAVIIPIKGTLSGAYETVADTELGPCGAEMCQDMRRWRWSLVENRKRNEEDKTPEAGPDNTNVSEAAESVCVEKGGVESLEVHPDGVMADPQLPEEKEAQEDDKEESEGKPVGEPHPSDSADDSVAESLQDSSAQQKAPESQESPDTSKEAEHKEEAAGGEDQAERGSAEEKLQPEEPPSEVLTQEQKTPEVKEEPAE